MTVKEAEEKTGLARSNIRFYEKEGLIKPLRNNYNGYREYSEKDIEDIKKIACLRTLGVSIESIKKIINKEVSLCKVIEKQQNAINEQIIDLKTAESICSRMLSEKTEYDEMDVEKYVPEYGVKKYWQLNSKIFAIDSVGFIYMWGGFTVWAILAAVCLITAVLSFRYLPEKMPVQWNNGEISSLVSKEVIFAYPAACLIIRFIIRPFIWRWLRLYSFCWDAIADYVPNFMCFTALSLEIFSVLFIYGIVHSAAFLILINTAVFAGLFVSGWYKLCRNKV